MGRVLLVGLVMLLVGCGSDDEPNSNGAGASGGAGGSSAGSGNPMGGGGIVGAAGRGYPDVLDPKDSPPKVGEPGCGFEIAAFCDTFGGASTVRGRAGDLHQFFWSGSRMASQVSTTRAMGIGMAMIPECRPELPDRVWPDQDTLICDPVFDVESGHLLIAAAAQNYGQNGYRVRQPIDFTGETRKIVFDASTDPLSPLLGWISLAVTEDPISLPGYSIINNDEGSIIPKNAVEVHFASLTNDQLKVRNIQVFDNYVDTVFEPPAASVGAAYSAGKLNHFEVLIAADQIEVRISPFSENGVTFGEPEFVYQQPVSLPLTRGYVHLSLHNHASIKYSQPDSGRPAIVDAPIARIDNVGFDGPLITNWREYEVPDALVEFTEETFQEQPDPYNPEHKGFDIGYVLKDVAEGPLQTLSFGEVDPSDIASARLAVTLKVDFLTMNGPPADYTLQARLNGNDWLLRKLTAEEAAFFGDGPTTLDASGQPTGNPGTQGRLALLIDVPVDDLVAGENTVEFVTANVPTSYPPVVLNVDLILQTN
jgi:hypothetical protein